MGGILDAALSSLSQQGNSSPAGAILQMLLKQQGGLGGLVNNLQKGGLGDIVGSWIGTGQNMPVSAQQLGSMFSADQLSQLTEMFGGNSEQAHSALAEHLPNIVDRLTPQGELPQGDDWMSQAGSMLGGLLK
jgi:uncharacterized protein YidB (DUF937 family)